MVAAGPGCGKAADAASERLRREMHCLTQGLSGGPGIEQLERLAPGAQPGATAAKMLPAAMVMRISNIDRRNALR